eukprot:TRINITY_DN1355_c0_g1_i1.p1 TRINITY_DN1355_c0_g1~~TRINITY_DN1355_c0_g1_i1.p1  ORF type:complete len:407 (-),score=77.08 TRINITY_DN1355_c0_g1_i1:672-1853(-)
MILAVGNAVVDFLASVSSFPEKDEKIRTTSLEIVTGGNCMNGLNAICSLGSSARFVTSVGNDANGEVIMNHLKFLGVDCQFVYRYDGATFFSYIIVDSKSRTRTIIHTPGTILDTTYSVAASSLLHGVELLYIDTRHPAFARQTCELAIQDKIPILLDVEQERGLGDYSQYFLLHSTYIVSSGIHLQRLSQESDPLKAMKEVLEEGVAEWVITTWGDRGSLLLRRISDEEGNAFERVSSWNQVETDILSIDASCVEGNEKDEEEDGEEGKFGEIEVSRFSYEEKYLLLHCSTLSLGSRFVDGTGAGDIFIGTLAHCIVNNFPLEPALKLAAYCAAIKCTRAGGASKGMVKRCDIPPQYLERGEGQEIGSGSSQVCGDLDCCHVKKNSSKRLID